MRHRVPTSVRQTSANETCALFFQLLFAHSAAFCSFGCSLLNQFLQAATPEWLSTTHHRAGLPKVSQVDFLYESYTNIEISMQTRRVFISYLDT